jgi:hypothetical protein
MRLQLDIDAARLQIGYVGRVLHVYPGVGIVRALLDEAWIACAAAAMVGARL